MADEKPDLAAEFGSSREHSLHYFLGTDTGMLKLFAQFWQSSLFISWVAD
jgi:uncharacterized protein with NAD-binding domain and iron-sulfur cluster